MTTIRNPGVAPAPTRTEARPAQTTAPAPAAQVPAKPAGWGAQATSSDPAIAGTWTPKGGAGPAPARNPSVFGQFLGEQFPRPPGGPSRFPPTDENIAAAALNLFRSRASHLLVGEHGRPAPQVPDKATLVEMEKLLVDHLPKARNDHQASDLMFQLKSMPLGAQRLVFGEALRSVSGATYSYLKPAPRVPGQVSKDDWLAGAKNAPKGALWGYEFVWVKALGDSLLRMTPADQASARQELAKLGMTALLKEIERGID